MLIEALKMPGTGRLTVTGQLGDVMRESVDAAYSYVRSRAKQLGIEDNVFRESDLHIHLPAGAIPKDGPSAGITLTLAIASALSGRPVRRDVAMTGEVTLRGKVLEIGGVKEKVLAAYRSGLRQVIMPKANEKDLREVPEEVRQNMAFTFVERMDEVLHLALLAPVCAGSGRHGPAGAVAGPRWRRPRQPIAQRIRSVSSWLDAREFCPPRVIGTGQHRRTRMLPNCGECRQSRLARRTLSLSRRAADEYVRRNCRSGRANRTNVPSVAFAQYDRGSWRRTCVGRGAIRRQSVRFAPFAFAKSRDAVPTRR